MYSHLYLRFHPSGAKSLSGTCHFIENEIQTSYFGLTSLLSWQSLSVHSHSGVLPGSLVSSLRAFALASACSFHLAPDSHKLIPWFIQVWVQVSPSQRGCPWSPHQKGTASLLVRLGECSSDLQLQGTQLAALVPRQPCPWSAPSQLSGVEGHYSRSIPGRPGTPLSADHGSRTP